MNNLENSVKRFLKRKVTVTLGFMVAFMISGSVGYAESIISKSEDTEVLLFMNGTFRDFDNEKIKNIGEFKLGEENVKPPVEPDKPTNPDKPTEPEKPIEPEKPQPIINKDDKLQENGIVFDIKENENFINEAEITYKSDIKLTNHDEDFTYSKPPKEAYAIKNSGGKVINKGTIKVEGMNDCNLGGSGTIIKTGEGVGVYQTSGTFENQKGAIIEVAGNGYDYDNNGGIDFSGGTGVLIEGGYATNNGIITSRESIILPNNSFALGKGIGMKAFAGTVENGKDGLIENQEYSMMAIEKGTAINNGTIETENLGIIAFNGGTAINNGTINAWKYTDIEEAGKGLYASSINGAKTVITNSETGKVYGSVRVEGENAKIINNGEIYGKEIIIRNGVIENNNLITGKDTKPVIDIEGGKFLQGVNGKLEAEKVNGDIYLSGNYGKNNFEDKISVNGLSIKEHNGKVLSNSVMYSYNTADNSLERKGFSKIMANQEFASYLEDNYLDGDIIRQELYNNLKLIDNNAEFNRATNNLFGNDIYPALKKQTLDMVRFNKNTLVKNVFETETTKEWRVIGGADYTNIEANPSNLSGYDTDIKSVFVGADKGINPNHRLGGIINVGALDSEFDMDNATREDTFAQVNIYSIYDYNGIKFINNFFVGISDGELERDLKFGDVYGKQKGDLDTTYLGLNNIVTKKFDFDTLYLKPKAEFNLTQLQMGDVKEDGNYGLEVEKQDVTSIEAGFGIEAGKQFDITDTLIGTVKVYGNYLAELSDPYEEMDVKLRRIDYADTVKLSDYDDEDYKDLGIRFEVSNESLTTYFEYNYTFDDDFYSVGVNYRF